LSTLANGSQLNEIYGVYGVEAWRDPGKDVPIFGFVIFDLNPNRKSPRLPVVPEARFGPTGCDRLLQWHLLRAA